MFILPINRYDYEGGPPYVVITLAAVNGVILAATYLLGSPEDVFQHYGFIPAHPHLWSAFAAMFLHAGLMHYLGNFFFLWMFGYRIENAFGRVTFLVVYLVCGFAAAFLHNVFNLGSTIPCIGASGAISGIVGCYLVLFPKSHFDLDVFLGWWLIKTIPTTTAGAVGAWIAEQTMLGVLSKVVPVFSTAFWGHVGGFAMGAALAAVLVRISPEIRARGESIRRSNLSRPRREVKQQFRYSRLAAPRLGGFVVDERNLPIENAQVSEVAADWTTPIRTTETDAQGRWSMTPHKNDNSYRLVLLKSPEFKEIRIRLKVHRKIGRDFRVNLPSAEQVTAASVSAG